MRLEIHISEIHIHVHIDNPSPLQSSIDQINQLAADEKAKTDKLNQAVSTAEGQPV